MGLSLDELQSPLDDIAFLSRSNNRIAVLRELARKDQTRKGLRDATEVSRPTLGRILEGFQERGWIVTTGSGNGHDYTLTSLGRVVFEEFSDMMGTLNTVQELRELALRIPFEELGLDPRDLADARITTPSPTDATAHSRRERELLDRSDRIQFLCNEAQPETIERYRDWIVEDNGRLEAIIASDAIDAAMADEEMGAYVRDMVAAEGVKIHRYEGDVSVMVGLLDDIASIIPLDDSGVAKAFIESTDDTVHAAVAETLRRYRNRAERVTSEGAPH